MWLLFDLGGRWGLPSWEHSIRPSDGTSGTSGTSGTTLICLATESNVSNCSVDVVQVVLTFFGTLVKFYRDLWKMTWKMGRSN